VDLTHDWQSTCYPMKPKVSGIMYWETAASGGAGECRFHRKKVPVPPDCPRSIHILFMPTDGRSEISRGFWWGRATLVCGSGACDFRQRMAFSPGINKSLSGYHA